MIEYHMYRVVLKSNVYTQRSEHPVLAIARVFLEPDIADRLNSPQGRPGNLVR